MLTGPGLLLIASKPGSMTPERAGCVASIAVSTMATCTPALPRPNCLCASDRHTILTAAWFVSRYLPETNAAGAQLLRLAGCWTAFGFFVRTTLRLGSAFKTCGSDLSDCKTGVSAAPGGSETP